MVSVKVIYEDGVLRPLESIELQEHEIVEVHFEPASRPKEIVKLGGSWAEYGIDLSYEDIEGILTEAKDYSLSRLLRQVDEVSIRQEY